MSSKHWDFSELVPGYDFESQQSLIMLKVIWKLKSCHTLPDKINVLLYVESSAEGPMIYVDLYGCIELKENSGYISIQGHREIVHPNITMMSRKG